MVVREGVRLTVRARVRARARARVTVRDYGNGGELGYGVR